MKKALRISGLLLVIMCIFTLASCAPNTVDKAEAKLEKKGYKVVTLGNTITGVKTKDDKTYQISVVFYADNERAKEAYEDSKDRKKDTIEGLEDMIDKLDSEDLKKEYKETLKETKRIKVVRRGRIVITGDRKAVNAFLAIF